MRYRIVESPLGNCRIQVRGKLPFTWVFVKKQRGPEGGWQVWIGSYAEAFEKCKEMEKKTFKLKYHYPPLIPPYTEGPTVTELPKIENPVLPPYHPGPGAILLNERL